MIGEEPAFYRNGLQFSGAIGGCDSAGDDSCELLRPGPVRQYDCPVTSGIRPSAKQPGTLKSGRSARAARRISVQLPSFFCGVPASCSGTNGGGQLLNSQTERAFSHRNACMGQRLRCGRRRRRVGVFLSYDWILCGRSRMFVLPSGATPGGERREISDDRETDPHRTVFRKRSGARG